MMMLHKFITTTSSYLKDKDITAISDGDWKSIRYH